ncbi:MAG: hypothetical protein ISR95_04670 [Candidatus Marinimicrobia bacterium]|nr:hypothetical protein [Candidatus Neomarinimicrobiota bacterium]
MDEKSPQIQKSYLVQCGNCVIFTGPEGPRKVKEQVKKIFGKKKLNSYKPNDQ